VIHRLNWFESQPESAWFDTAVSLEVWEFDPSWLICGWTRCQVLIKFELQTPDRLLKIALCLFGIETWRGNEAGMWLAAPVFSRWELFASFWFRKFMLLYIRREARFWETVIVTRHISVRPVTSRDQLRKETRLTSSLPEPVKRVFEISSAQIRNGRSCILRGLPHYW
jgi:hypothetical protein